MTSSVLVASYHIVNNPLSAWYSHLLLIDFLSDRQSYSRCPRHQERWRHELNAWLLYHTKHRWLNLQNSLTNCSHHGDNSTWPTSKDFQPVRCPANGLVGSVHGDNSLAYKIGRPCKGGNLPTRAKQDQCQLLAAQIQNSQTGFFVNPQFNVECNSSFETIKESITHISHYGRIKE